MKLALICESNDDLYQYFITALSEYPESEKLIKWAFSKNNYTNPSGEHCYKEIALELIQNLRLVGNPWKSGSDVNFFKNMIVKDYGKQLLVSLPQNEDILDLVMTSEMPDTHIVRGLAFGYDPASVKQYSMIMTANHGWKGYVHSLGVKLMSDYSKKAYASTFRKGLGNVVVYPKDINTTLELINRNKLDTIMKWCPTCYNYVQMSDYKGPDYGLTKEECNHEIIFNKDDPNNSTWYIISVKVIDPDFGNND